MTARGRHTSTLPAPAPTLPQPVQLSPEEVEILRSFVWQGCNDAELRFGLQVCQSLGLNPLLRHVVFIKSPGKSGNLYTTRDGLLHMAHQSGQFNGMQSGVVYARNAEGEILLQQERKVLEGAWCRVYRKDMEYPFEVEVNFEEYNRPKSPVWQQYPAAMIKKVSEHMALKLAFNVSGLASIEEIGMEEPATHERVPLDTETLERRKAHEKEVQQSMKILIETIRQLQERYGLTKPEIQEVTGHETLRGLTLKELEGVVLCLNEHCLAHKNTHQIATDAPTPEARKKRQIKPSAEPAEEEAPGA